MGEEYANGGDNPGRWGSTGSEMASQYKCLTAWECGAVNRKEIKERKGSWGGVKEVIHPVYSYARDRDRGA